MKRKKWWIAIGLICLGGVFGLFVQTEDYACIPLTFGKDKCPIVPVGINGNNYYLELDIGANSFLTLDANILSHTKKQDYGWTSWADLKGNRYETRSYILDRIYISDIAFDEVLTKEMDNYFFLNTSINNSTDLDRPLGTIGSPLLKRINLFLDFPNAKLILTDSSKRLKKAGYLIEGMTGVPFRFNRTGIVLSIETDLGEKKFMLDTGSTLTLLRASLLNQQNLTEKEGGLQTCSSSKFQMGGKNFGKQDFYRYDLSDEFTEIDGVLGMDFMKIHQIYIDYVNRIIYIGDASS